MIGKYRPGVLLRTIERRPILLQPLDGAGSWAARTKQMGSPGRTAYGPAISVNIFFEVSEAAACSTEPGPVLTAKLRAQDRHEIWLESCDGQLSDFEGTLAIFGAPDLRPTVAGLLGMLRRGSPYELTLFVSEEELTLASARLLNSQGRPILMVEFDLEYNQGWDSPGGYSPAYGVRYWDDVAYPSVVIKEYRFE